jgi:hypothetical protein
VIGTGALVAPAGKFTTATAVAAAGLSEPMVTLSPPAGAAAERFSVRLCVAPVDSVKVCCEKLRVPVTRTVWFANPKPAADAVILADPKLTPVTCGCVAGVFDPAAINTLEGIVTLDESLLDSATVTPPVGALVERVTGKGAELPGVTLTLEGSPMLPKTITVIAAFALTMLAPFTLPVMFADPTDTPVTGTLMLDAFCAMVTFVGTVATVGLSELRLTTKPPAGAVPERLRVRF